MRKTLLLGVLVVTVLVVTGCGMAEPNPFGPGEAGFWDGLWHGLISIPLLVYKFATSRSGEVAIYEVHNSGAWYDLGFVLALFCVGSIGSFIANESGKKATKR